MMRPSPDTGRQERRALVQLALLLAALALPSSPAALASDVTADPFDRELNQLLGAMSPEQATEAIRWLIEPKGSVTEFYAVSPGHVTDRNADLDSATFTPGDGYFSTMGNGARCAFAPVHLPQGATILGLVVWYVDEDPGNYSVTLHRKATATTAGAQELAAVGSSGASSGIRVATDLTIVNAVVDNDTYAYWVNHCTPQVSHELHGIYLSYTR